VDGDWRIDQIVIQTELQKSYAILYGDFFIVDGTHGTNIHGMTLLLPCTIDCMGKTKIVGVILCHNESRYMVIGNIPYIHSRLSFICLGFIH
jgi:hypothetical protein